MKWLLLWYSKYDHYTRCFRPFETKEAAIEHKNKVLHDCNIIDIVELKEPLYL